VVSLVCLPVVFKDVRLILHIRTYTWTGKPSITRNAGHRKKSTLLPPLPVVTDRQAILFPIGRTQVPGSRTQPALPANYLLPGIGALVFVVQETHSVGRRPSIVPATKRKAQEYTLREDDSFE
jgi:hypothetical protein